MLEALPQLPTNLKILTKQQNLKNSDGQSLVQDHMGPKYKLVLLGVGQFWVPSLGTPYASFETGPLGLELSILHDWLASKPQRASCGH